MPKKRNSRVINEFNLPEKPKREDIEKRVEEAFREYVEKFGHEPEIGETFYTEPTYFEELEDGYTATITEVYAYHPGCRQRALELFAHYIVENLFNGRIKIEDLLVDEDKKPDRY